MSTGLIPALFTRLVDDAAVFPPGSAPLPEAIIGHREHRAAWYAELVGPLLLPSSALTEAARLLKPDERLEAGLIGDGGVDALAGDLAAADERLEIGQVEVAVAKRGEDPEPGLRRLLAVLAERPSLTAYAEIPLTWGLLAALDTVAEARAAGVAVAAKFRTGGLAAELFPTPVELAAVICACRDRELPFKLTAGLHNAIRHTDPETGFVHHGFLNVLVGTAAAVDGAEVADVAELLAATDPVPLIEPARALRDGPRPLWIGFGSCSVVEPLTDLIRLGLVNGGFS
ncbi:hypothetical protein [Phytohabitans suffuscus]|uniref:HpcH/HpaI aldolase/citrate lyase domain-containing protein n=1 Tax=Phytohabitans suffuscus TaxID=624315 RepID=A0A6F8YHN7_9ACTN|nr:hypothetical protein [Phytohabitans suffuscus]BCB85600.1 hypothetical protein Psuf_029130 [Phytohabitans suffuscus]